MDWSPDNRKLAFTRYVVATNQPSTEIYTVNANGTGQRRITHNQVVDEQPAWSPDGKAIAFSSTRTPGTSAFLNWNLYTMTPAGGSVRRLTSRPAAENSVDDRFPSWSPDGKHIAFDSSVRAGDRFGEPDVFIVDVPSRRLSSLTHTSAGEYDPNWSPDGKTILVARFSGSYSFEFWPAAGGNPRLVLNTTLDLSPYFDYSPDGKKIAFVGNPKGDSSASGKYIYVANSGAGDPMRLSRAKGDYGDLSWSPDGKRIAFERNGQIYVMNANGSNERRLPLK